jgi:hypothetical protein
VPHQTAVVPRLEPADAGRCVHLAARCTAGEAALIAAAAKRQGLSVSAFLRVAAIAAVAALPEPEIFPRHMPREVFDNDC